EVSSAVRTMDEMTQHNAALVEETNAAIEQTEAQASELDRIVDIFTVSAAQAAGRPRPEPARAEPLAPGGVRGMQDKLKAVARTYLKRGNTALKADADWSEF